MSRNSISIYDAGFARKQQTDALALPSQGIRTQNAPRLPALPADVAAKLVAALALEASKLRARDEERRRRDPTYRPDAVGFGANAAKPFDAYIDYYARLQVDEFASLADIKASFKRMSLLLHPDKQVGKSATEAAAAAEEYFAMCQAYELLSDAATRRAYDLARDKRNATVEAGLTDIGKCERPPPTCVDVEVTLEEMFRGCRKQVTFVRNEFKGTRHFKTTKDEFVVKVVKRDGDCMRVDADERRSLQMSEDCFR